MSSFLVQSVISGVFATIVLDLWQRLLFAVAGIPPANWGLIGRWFAHMPRGRFVHDAIAEAEPVSGEAKIGWTLHYLIGIAYGLVYVGLIVHGLDSRPSLLNGFVFGLASVVIPWFLMQPALGLGVMGRRTPKPWIPSLTALANHCLYGVALYLGAVLARGL